MEEVRSIGLKYSCTNRQLGDSRIYSKLDCVFSNEKWCDEYNACFTSYHANAISDHCFMLLKCICPDESGLKPFRYYNMWAEHPEFRNLVAEVWCSINGGPLLRRIDNKLAKLRRRLREFNQNTFGDIEVRFRKANQEVINAQTMLQSNPDDMNLLTREKDALSNYATASLAYEKFLHQKSKITWLRLGDDGTGYFHASLKGREAQNRILSFLDNGPLLDDFEKVRMHFLNHFKSFMGTESPANGAIDMKFVTQGPVLDSDKQLRLIKPFSAKEIKETLFSIDSNKSPGLDGFGAGFFKSSWDIVGKEVVQAVNEFFTTHSLPKNLSTTVLVLIPKVSSPSSANDFRPIACCSTIYKCVAKLICNRMNMVLPNIISDNQGAFIKGGSLAHNILIIQDLLRAYGRANISSRCMMKIDLSKAYDTISWRFVENLLNALCFSTKFVKWTMSCLSSAHYSLLINGRIQGEFEGRKGLR